MSFELHIKLGLLRLIMHLASSVSSSSKMELEKMREEKKLLGSFAFFGHWNGKTFPFFCFLPNLTTKNVRGFLNFIDKFLLLNVGF